MGWRWSPFPKALSQTPVFTLQDHGYKASASRGAPVYVPAFAGTHCAYPWMDGQAELTWVPGYIPEWSSIQVLTRPGVYQLRWFNQQRYQLSQTTTPELGNNQKNKQYFQQTQIPLVTYVTTNISTYLFSNAFQFSTSYYHALKITKLYEIVTPNPLSSKHHYNTRKINKTKHYETKYTIGNLFFGYYNIYKVSVIFV